jgi:hypothetical protein
MVIWRRYVQSLLDVELELQANAYVTVVGIPTSQQAYPDYQSFRREISHEKTIENLQLAIKLTLYPLFLNTFCAVSNVLLSFMWFFLANTIWSHQPSLANTE